MNNFTIKRLDKTIDDAAEPFLAYFKVLESRGNDEADDEDNARPEPLVTPWYVKVCLLLYVFGFFISVNHLLDRYDYKNNNNSIKNTWKSWNPFASIPSSSKSKETFLLGIFSENNKEGASRRGIIRQEYIKKRGGEHVCSLGQYLEANRAGNKIPCQVAYTFIVGEEGQDRGPHHDCPDCTFLKVDDVELEEKGLAFVHYAASMPPAWARFDNILKMDDTSAYLTFLSTIVEDWDLDNNSRTTRRSSSSSRPKSATTNRGPLKQIHMMEFVDGEHPAGSTNNLVYGSPYIPTRRNSIFNRGQVYFMTMELAKYISTSMDQNASASWLSSNLLTNLKPKQKVDVDDSAKVLLRKNSVVANTLLGSAMG
eukprot:794606_1